MTNKLEQFSKQMTFFDMNTNDKKSETINNESCNENTNINCSILKRLQNYTLEDYIEDVENLGIEATWDNICEYLLKNHDVCPFLNTDSFGELYEIGLSLENKKSKKQHGQYFTPNDVAKVMSKWLINCSGYNICDVGCGTGNLILAYLNSIGYEKAKELILQKRVFLYDFDYVALKICKTLIALKYGIDTAECINVICCDFLDKNIILPEKAKVIVNPPYSSINEFKSNWEITQNLKNTKELYSAFMEKIFSQAESSVIITPFSFISSRKFYALRKLMCSKGHGFIVSFDNVPGNIFCGTKKGIFNTNKTNSVRAAITLFEKSGDTRGFKTSHLIRFKSTERKKIINSEYLENVLSQEYQIIDDKNTKFRKINIKLQHIYDAWISASTNSLKDYIVENGEYNIYMPNTCRYFTSASNEKINRNGQIVLSFDNEDVYNYVFCLINSSFVYWHWRIYDGGITYPIGLLEEIPMFFEKLSPDDKLFFKKIANKMIANKNKFIVTKNNIGLQENIKYPKEYRDKLNNRFLGILGINDKEDVFNTIHSNAELEAKL